MYMYIDIGQSATKRFDGNHECFAAKQEETLSAYQAKLRQTI